MTSVKTSDKTASLGDELLGYLRPDGSCVFTEDAALSVLAGLAAYRDKNCGALEGEAAEVLSLQITQMERVVQAYRSGELREEDVTGPSFVRSREAHVFTGTSGSGPETYAPAAVEPPASLIEAREESFAPSPMNFEALTTERAVGSINPPVGMSFVTGDLRTPTAWGMVRSLTPAFYDYPEHQPSPLPGKGEGDVTASYPRRTDIVPLPFDRTLTSISRPEGGQYSEPDAFDPLVNRLEQPTRGLTFTFSPDESEPRRYGSMPHLEPSSEEQGYLRAILSLPPELAHELSSSGTPEERVALIAGFMGGAHHSGLTNFRYVCHDRFGEFINDNLQDLVLNLSVLRVGHCDLLAWYAALALRSQGVTAWVATVTNPTKDGTAFNGSCDHAVVAFVSEDSSIRYFDPTKICRPDPAYHPDVLPSERVENLASKFRAAADPDEKRSVLMEFLGELPARRETAAANESVRSDMARLFADSMFASATTSAEFQPIMVHWSDMPAAARHHRHLSLLRGMEELFSAFHALASSGRIRPDEVLQYFDSFSAARTRRDAAALLDISASERVSPHRATFSTDRVLEAHYQRDPSSTVKRAFLAREEPDICDYPRVRTAAELLDSIGYGLPDRDYPNKEKSESDTSGFFVTYTLGLRMTDLAGMFLNERDRLKNHRFTTKISLQCLKSPESLEGLSDSIYERYIDDLAIAHAYYQLSLLDRTVQKEFCGKLGISEDDFNRHVVDMADFSRPRRMGTGVKRNPSHVIAAIANEQAYIPSDQRARFGLNLRRLLRETDHQRSSRTSYEDLRKYVGGDDLRQLDWNVFARHEELFVRQSPVRVQDFSSPLHVLVDEDAYGGLASCFHVSLLLQELKTIHVQNDIEIHVGRSNEPVFYRLARSTDVAGLAAHFVEPTWNKPVGPLLPNGKPPRNILFAGADREAFLELAYRMGPRSDLRMLQLAEPRFMLYPLARDSWISRGFSQGLRERGRSASRDVRGARSTRIVL